MHPLQRALIEKAGHDNGFEYVLSGDAEHATLASARHPARVRVAVIGQGYEVGIDSGSATLAQELARTFATSRRVPPPLCCRRKPCWPIGCAVLLRCRRRCPIRR